MNSLFVMEERLRAWLSGLEALDLLESSSIRVNSHRPLDEELQSVVVKVNEALARCLLDLKPKTAEIRNVITRLVRKKNSLSEIHGAMESFQCELCGKDFDAKVSLKQHLRMQHRLAEFKCRTCGGTFKSKGNLKTHELIHSNVRRFLCEVCGVGFVQCATLKYHMMSKHDEHNQHKRFECGACHARFLTRTRLDLHFKTHEEPGFRCEECGRMFTSEKLLNSHKTTHGQRSFQCAACGNKFVSASRLRFHVKECHESRVEELRCERCGVTYKSRSGLRAHVVEKHSLWACEKPNCRVRFKRAKDLERHVASGCVFTPTPQPSRCADCRKVFAHARSLTKHVRLKHSAPRDEFPCELCRKTFSERRKLQRHLATHGEERFGCEECGRRFARLDGLRRHVAISHRMLKAFQCRFCQKTFSVKCNKDIHEENVHGGLATAMQCEVCGRTCKNRTTLNIHLKTHVSRGLACSLCDKTYLRKTHLETHLRNKHGGVSAFQALLDSVVG